MSLEQKCSRILDSFTPPSLNCQALAVQGEARHELGGGYNGMTAGSRVKGVMSGLVSEGEKN